MLAEDAVQLLVGHHLVGVRVVAEKSALGREGEFAVDFVESVVAVGGESLCVVVQFHFVEFSERSVWVQFVYAFHPMAYPNISKLVLYDSSASLVVARHAVCHCPLSADAAQQVEALIGRRQRHVGVAVQRNYRPSAWYSAYLPCFGAS